MHAFRPFDDTGNRRSACNRCRSHKLRCERFAEEGQCRRCLKAKSECVTSAALKSGRPAHLYVQNEQKASEQVYYSSETLHLGAQQALPTFPTPPPTTREGILDNHAMLQDPMIDMHLFRSPSAFDTTWTEIFEFGSASHGESLTAMSRHVAEQQANTTDSLLSDKNVELMRRLGELQTKILIDLEAVKSCGTADKCTRSATPGSESHQAYNYLIGHMLDSSTALLNILECFQPVSNTSTQPSGENGSDATTKRDDRARCNAPTMFTLASCYVCLVRIYRTIFSCIYDSLPFLLGSPTANFQLFPGMNLGGFKLEPRLDLQVQILLHVSEDMLARIEAKFGIPNAKSSGGNSIFDPVKIANTLHSMLEEESNEQPPLQEQRGESAPLRQILAGIKQAIDIRSAK
ncbi:uncharacterized protein A1O9_06609 [Exophiala aquamarina CBS 119918]|uniref:Zn(2)-C6 fungal-type domain-containing protein n=1 Tax=Exophiala aquamarina CBS 119918 TaxID=1182545 RepID=A0A072PHA5_9EURO|nr:uncharacterized protein A1O9_06609 [Exophiala aquamarina CBS 119918]KEF58683.1 hypothetical protein A1O9_06609 [Exophiala aquamarina CBS 119918]